MPTLAGFTTFIRDSMGISTVVLPDGAPVIADSYAVALEIVNELLPLVSTTIYTLAVYNLAGDTLVNAAPDVSVVNSSITWAASVATVTTATPHGFATGTPVVVAATAPSGYNTAAGAPASVTVTGASTYTYAIPTSPGVSPATQPGTSSLTFFADLRKRWNIAGFVAGVVQSSGDEGTNESLLVPDALKGLTLADLQNLKTPWGRQYLAYAQRCGPLWGLT